MPRISGTDKSIILGNYRYGCLIDSELMCECVFEIHDMWTQMNLICAVVQIPFKTCNK